MTHAYQEIYLSNAQAALGDAFDYAIRVCGVSGENFIKLFTVSSVSKHMENGEPAYLAGKSGIELAAQILAETTGMTEQPEQPERYERSGEYWIGWAVAYYQWYSGRKYSEIFEVLSFVELEKIYYTLHEADVSKFAEIADARIREHFAETNLKRIRTAYGCSQAELAKNPASACAPSSCTNSGKRTSTRQARRACIRFPECLAARWRTCWKDKNTDFYPVGADESPCFCAGAVTVYPFIE